MNAVIRRTRFLVTFDAVVHGRPPMRPADGLHLIGNRAVADLAFDSGDRGVPAVRKEDMIGKPVDLAPGHSLAGSDVLDELCFCDGLSLRFLVAVRAVVDVGYRGPYRAESVRMAIHALEPQFFDMNPVIESERLLNLPREPIRLRQRRDRRQREEAARHDECGDDSKGDSCAAHHRSTAPSARSQGPYATAWSDEFILWFLARHGCKPPGMPIKSATLGWPEASQQPSTTKHPTA